MLERREGGREEGGRGGGREGGSEGGREGGRERGREGEREGEREGREVRREGGSEGGREGGREGEREGWKREGETSADKLAMESLMKWKENRGSSLSCCACLITFRSSFAMYNPWVAQACRSNYDCHPWIL